jgi:hypothetical protein
MEVSEVTEIEVVLLGCLDPKRNRATVYLHIPSGKTGLLRDGMHRQVAPSMDSLVVPGPEQASLIA